MSEKILDRITASAVSYIVAGDSGISSFLTLFVLGCVEKSDPSLLNMDDTMEFVLSSWISLFILAVLSLMEFIAMCVPVVDELTDTAMTFVIPVVSFVGMLGTLGLYDTSSATDDDEGFAVDLSNFGSSGDDGGGRRLDAASTALTVWKVVVIVSGIVLAITMHLLKMLVRLIGEGWLTNILTIIETAWCITSLIVAIYFRTVAIIIAGFIIGMALWVWVRRCRRSQQQREEEEAMRQRQLEQRQIQLTERNGVLPQTTSTTAAAPAAPGTTTTTTTTTTVVTTTAEAVPY